MYNIDFHTCIIRIVSLYMSRAHESQNVNHSTPEEVEHDHVRQFRNFINIASIQLLIPYTLYMYSMVVD